MVIATYRDYTKRINKSIGHIKLSKLKPTTLLKFYKELQEPTVLTYYILKYDLKTILKERGITQTKFVEENKFSKWILLKMLHSEPLTKEQATIITSSLKFNLKDDFHIIHEEKNISNKTIQNYHRFLSSVLSTAVNWQILSSNPAERVSPPRVRKTEALSLSKEDSIELLKALENEPTVLSTAIITLLYTGMRRGECLGLTWQAIDFEKCKISIHQSVLYLPEKGVYTDTPKTSSSIRTISVPNIVIETLSKWKFEQEKHKSKLKTEWIDENWVFTRWNGSVIRPDYLTSWFHAFIKNNNCRLSIFIIYVTQMQAYF